MYYQPGSIIGHLAPCSYEQVLFQLYNFLYMHVHVCVRERDSEREREIGSEGGRERK